MDLNIPLNRLKFGHQDGDGINARVTGRDKDIAALAANLHAQGQIENLIVKDAGDGFYAVANGNRRLAAFHMIYGEASSHPIACTVHDVDSATAFEFSLVTAITARQLHPVDQYEAFARLDERGKTHEEIAAQYGMTEKEVRQALALGRLSPKIRAAWRGGEIKAEVARAFTLGLDHKSQDRAFDKLKAEGRLMRRLIQQELGAVTSDDIAQLLDFVGVDAYRGAGGAVTEDLFGRAHVIGDVTLLEQLARERLNAACGQLIIEGWGWAAIKRDLPKGAQFWPQSEPKSLQWQGDEKARLEAAEAAMEAMEDEPWSEEGDEKTNQLGRECDEIRGAVRARSFDESKRRKLGCIVDVEDGRLVVLTGIKRPVEAESPARPEPWLDGEPATKAKPAGSAAAAPEEPEISPALLARLSIQLTKAAATALITDEQLALSVLLAGVGCYAGCGVKISVNGLGARDRHGDRSLLGADEMSRALPLAIALQPAERIALLAQLAADALDFAAADLLDRKHGNDAAIAVCDAMDPATINASLRGAFDAKDYFGGVNKAILIKAIEEAMGPDHARAQAKRSRSEIAAFALENVPPTGWLPPQLRVKGYDGPPVKAAKLRAVKPTGGDVKPSGRDVKAARKSVKPKAAKRAASAKKAARKTAAKKRRA